MKTPKRRFKKKSPKTLQNKIWKLCKEITRKKYGNECYTCTQKNLVGSNWQTGHFIPKAILDPYLKYDLRVLRPQCMRCNYDLGGNGAEFMRKMIIREGQEYVDQIFRERRFDVSSKEAYTYYESLIPRYEQILEEL